MIVVPLSDRTHGAVHHALLSLGWEGDLASLTGGGLATSAFLVHGVDSDAIEAMLPLAARLGLEMVTGEDWIILAGGRSRLGAFARPWVQPEPVRALADAIGRAMPPEPATAWHHATGALSLTTPVLLGIVNVTPDSFSPPSRARDANEALRLVDQLRAGGATMIDVGGESTRPGAQPVAAEDERARVVPVIAAIVARHPDLPLAVDTVRAETARLALEAGASVINDVTAGRHDPAILTLAATTGAGIVLSHSRGALGALARYDLADYDGDVTSGVVRELAGARAAAHAAGVADERIVLDPGFGFAKTPEQNFALLDQLDAVVALGRPVLVGVSRKRFLAGVTADDLGALDRATAAACVLAHDRGARLFRVHDPATARDGLAVAAASGARAGAGG
jgi:dihydropteroate synthase